MRELVETHHPYSVLTLDIHSVMVIIHSPLDTQDYWGSMQKLIVERYPTCKKVIFDFTLRNGIKDRFYETTISGKSFESVHKTNNADTYIETSNDFYVHHLELINKSSLSDFQKRFLITRVLNYKEHTPLL